MAREITGPVQRLAEGTQEVALGNLDLHIREGGDDEMGILISSFNKMTRDLKGARFDLEERQKYLEAILTNLSIGIVAVDNQLKINLTNDLALKILGFERNALSSLAALPDSTISKEISKFIKILESEERVLSETPLKIILGGRQLEVLCSAAKVQRDTDNDLGYVFIFEDVTDISIAHQMAAWREVARRIAHEIKNPLTPIKLSAQRLGKISSGDIKRQDVLDSVQTIVENVESIKRLANEFSNFARMPTAEFSATDINSLISDVVSPFIEENQDILFQVILDRTIPTAEIDPEQVRRLMINIIGNAVDALRNGDGKEIQKVIVRTQYISDKNRFKIEISDTGPGIKPEDKGRIFEPYFTTKRDGTGLGLAIVNSVVSDHRGTVNVFDNAPRGTMFSIVFPVKQTELRVPKVNKI